jgi:macrolide transport system ATP-binding/permease protein
LGADQSNSRFVFDSWKGILMKFLRAVIVRLCSLFRRKQQDREFAEEMASHLAMHVEDNLRSGMSPEEARRKALIKLGGVDRTFEECRDRQGFRWFEVFLHDMRHAIKALCKSPGFSFASAMTLALAIAANCIVFSVAYAVLFRPLPYREPEQLHHVFWGFQGEKALSNPAIEDFIEWKGRNSVFEDMAMTSGFSPSVKLGEFPESANICRATTNLFKLLGVKPVLGRTFSVDEGIPGSDTQTAILSHDYWQQRFHGDPNILGRTLDLGDRHATVIGVLQPGFKFNYSQPIQIWLPLPESRKRPSWSRPAVIARLKSGVTPIQAADGMRAVLTTLAREYPETNRNHTEVQLVSLLIQTLATAEDFMHPLFPRRWLYRWSC